MCSVGELFFDEALPITLPELFCQKKKCYMDLHPNIAIFQETADAQDYGICKPVFHRAAVHSKISTRISSDSIMQKPLIPT